MASKVEHSAIHRRILELGIEHIITPNYDFALEKAGGLQKESPERHDGYNETVYSLFRLYDLNGYKIWHIHGDVSTPRSINLGYEQYSGSLHRMRDYVLTGVIRKEIGGGLMRRLSHGPIEVQSWLDLFFTKNIFMFGFRFDQVEMHLWWLVAYRARRIAERQIRKPNRFSRFCPTNRIVYYYPKSLLSNAKTETLTRRRLTMLKAFDVKPMGLPGRPGKEDYYNAVIDHISENLSTTSG